MAWCRLDFPLTETTEQQLFRGGRRESASFRKLIAALNTKYNIGLPASAFGYKDNGESDSQAEICIGYGTTGRGLSITAVGIEAAELLSDRSGAINAALMHAAGALIPMHARTGEHEANFLPSPMPFYIHNLMLGKGRSTCFWKRAADNVHAGSNWLAEADRKIKKSIGTGLMRQAVLLGRMNDSLEGNVASLIARSMVDGVHWNETGAEFGDRLGIEIKTIGGHTFVNHGGGGHRLVLKNVEFTMKADFTGPWFVGRLKLESQGQVMPASARGIGA